MIVPHSKINEVDICPSGSSAGTTSSIARVLTLHVSLRTEGSHMTYFVLHYAAQLILTYSETDCFSSGTEKNIENNH